METSVGGNETLRHSDNGSDDLEAIDSYDDETSVTDDEEVTSNDSDDSSVNHSSLSANEDACFMDNWEEAIEVEADDASTSVDQRSTLLLLGKCRTLITTIKQSSVLTNHFLKQRNLARIKRNLAKDIRNRWNSSFLMIDSFLILRPIVEKLFTDKHQLSIRDDQIHFLGTLEISTTEWNHLVQLHQILQVFYHATKIMSGTKYPSIGCAYFVLAKLRLFLCNDVADNAVAKRIKKLLLAKYIQYFEDDREQLNLLKVSAKSLFYFYLSYWLLWQERLSESDMPAGSTFLLS